MTIIVAFKFFLCNISIALTYNSPIRTKKKDNSTGCKLELSFDLEVVMSITNIPININIRNFDDRDCQKKLQKYFDNHRGTNVSIKELKMNDVVCDANNKLLNLLRSLIPPVEKPPNISAIKKCKGIA